MLIVRWMGIMKRVCGKFCARGKLVEGISSFEKLCEQRFEFEVGKGGKFDGSCCRGKKGRKEDLMILPEVGRKGKYELFRHLCANGVTNAVVVGETHA